MSEEQNQPEGSMPPTPPSAPHPPAHPAAASGPYVPNQDECTFAMLVHLVAILAGIVGCLILWLVKKDSSQFINHHGKEAVNFQITLLLVMLVSVGIGVVAAIISISVFESPFGFLVLTPFISIVPILGLIFEIRSCLKANRGEWSRYPLTLRLIR